MTENLKIEYLPIEKLTPYGKNARKHADEDVSAIVASIRKFGFADPIGVWGKKNTIVEGHGRLMAAKELGMTEVPVLHLDWMSDEERRAYGLAHNRTAELSEWDFETLRDDLDEISFDMSEFGFDMDEDDGPTEIVEDEVPEVNEDEQPITQKGDLWQLGEHRLLCGDALSLTDVQRLMGGELADLLLTDPPYNVALGMGGSVDEARKRHRRTDGLVIMNDKMSNEDFYQFLLQFYKTAAENLKPGAAFYVWHADNEGLNFRRALADAGLQLRQTLIWNKNCITLGRQDYQWKHEPCLYGWKDGASHNWHSDRAQSTVLDFKKPSKSEDHPTMKPVELFAYLMQNSTKKGDAVLDVFSGSGTTMIAAEQTDRKAYCMELDHRYCDVIVRRWENLTGGKAKKCN